MSSSLAFKVLTGTGHVKRALDVLLVLHGGKKVACTGQKEQHRHHEQRSGHEKQTQPLDNTHEQVKSAPGPVVVEVADEVGERVGQRTDFQQKRNLHKQHNQALHDTDDGENDHQVEMENVGDSERYT